MYTTAPSYNLNWEEESSHIYTSPSPWFSNQMICRMKSEKNISTFSNIFILKLPQFLSSVHARSLEASYLSTASRG